MYGVEEGALVMELVEGATFADRIVRSPLSPEEALPLIEPLGGAAYAHDKGVVHRDLKPAKIKVTLKGLIQIVDFGLAKALGSEAPPGHPGSSPTSTMEGTALGVIPGTAGYMAWSRRAAAMWTSARISGFSAWWCTSC
jgi:serine/threonine-protein kinase